MNTLSPQFGKVLIVAAAAIAAMTMASCALTSSSSPKQVGTSNPTVTYQYRNDDELIQANRRATAFCEPYQSSPQAQSFSSDPEGRRIVVFECVQASRVAPMDRPDSALRYSYRTDQELLEVSRKAQIYCTEIGKPEVGSNIVVHADGSKTVTFQCNSR